MTLDEVMDKVMYGTPGKPFPDNLRTLIEAHAAEKVAEAVKAEREACAALCDAGVTVKLTGDSIGQHYGGRTFAFMIRARTTESNAKRDKDAITRVVGTPEPDLGICPRCGGEADNGHDRLVPPNPYPCSKCINPDM